MDVIASVIGNAMRNARVQQIIVRVILPAIITATVMIVIPPATLNPIPAVWTSIAMDKIMIKI